MFFRRFTLVPILLTCSIAFAQHPQPEQNVYGESLPNLGEVKTELKHYHDCDGKNGCYEKDIEQQAAKAVKFLETRAAQRKPGEKLAAVFDIDETALSNYPYYLITDFGYEPGRFDMWVMSANAAPLKPVLGIYNTAREFGISVFFITGRNEEERFATEQNLLRAGYKDWAGLILRTPADARKKAADYKPAARQTITSRGYDIILNVGDQLSDLSGDPQAEMSIKLPDPFYFIP